MKSEDKKSKAKISNVGFDTIKEIYKKYNYPSKDKLYNIVKKDHPEISRSEIQNFTLNSVKESFKEIRTKQKLGHITALQPNEIWQIDLFDLSKYGKKNKGYDYIFCAVDVFSRRLMICPIKQKEIKDCLGAMKAIFKANKMQIPNIIMSDNESAFTSKEFNNFLDDHNIILKTNVKHDHYALGIVDNMAKRLKKLIGIYIHEEDDPQWLKYYDTIVDNYNKNEEHPALGYMAPDNVQDSKENINLVQNINLNKNLDNIKIKSDLSIGDRVKILENIKHNPFSKSDTPKYSSKIYDVIKVQRSNITLNDNKIYRSRNLLKVGKDVVEKQTPNIRATIKDKVVDRRVKKTGVDRNDDQRELITSVKRNDRKKKDYSDFYI